MRQAFIHVGLHKTATTSIQRYVFQRYHGAHVNYLGVRHPRVGGGTPEYDSFMRLATCVSETEFNAKLPDFQSKLREADSDIGLPLLISDENIYCAEIIAGEIPVGERVNRIGRIFEDYELRVVATVRPQAEALFSLYVQMYPFLASPKPNFEEFLSHASLLECYLYDLLFDRFSALDCFGDMLFVDYQGLETGEIARLCDFLAVPHCSIGHLNRREQDGKNKFTKASLGEFLLFKNHKLARLLKKNKITYNAAKSIFRLMNAVELRSTPLAIPSSETQRSIRAHYQKSNVRFRDLTGIDYVRNLPAFH